MFVYPISHFEAGKKKKQKGNLLNFLFSFACAVRWVCVCPWNGIHDIDTVQLFSSTNLSIWCGTRITYCNQLSLVPSGFRVFVPFLWFFLSLSFFFWPAKSFIPFCDMWGWVLSTDEQWMRYILIYLTLSIGQKLLFISIVCWMTFVLFVGGMNMCFISILPLVLLIFPVESHIRIIAFTFASRAVLLFTAGSFSGFVFVCVVK